MSINPPDNIIEFIGTSVENTEMAIADVSLPGVYEITESGGGMTAKYMAEKQQGSSGSEGEDPYGLNEGDDGEDESYATGTLLLNDGSNSPVLDENGNRIRIAYDELQDQRFRDAPAPNIISDNPATEEDESDTNTGYVVVGADDDPQQPVLLPNDEGNPIALAEGGYTIATGDGEDGEGEGEDGEGEDGEGEGEDGEGEDSGSGPIYNPDGSPTGNPAPGLIPEGASAIQPPPIKLTVNAYCSDETWDALDGLRDREQPFDVAIGEFAVERMGVTDLSRNLSGELYGANDVTIKLKQFEEVTVQQIGMPQGGPGDTGQSSGSQEEGPVRGWIDQNNDGVDDRSGEDIPEYEELELDAGETYTREVGDGELWGNKHIDASADGASVNITASGDGWVVKNVGIEGAITPAMADGGMGTLAVGEETPSVITMDVPSGGQGVVENLYLGDGVVGEENNLTGVLVTAQTAGTAIVNRVTIEGMGVSGVSASPPGKPDAGNGTVEVSNSYLANNNVSNLRLGSTGSFAQNCMLLQDGNAPTGPNGRAPRGYWGWYALTGLEDCDIKNSDGAAPAIATGEGGSVTANATTVEGAVEGDVEGVEEGTPSVYHPTGAPDGPADAASRGGSIPPGAGGPPSDQNWEVIMQDDFEGGSINQDYWSMGYGWGMNSGPSDEIADPSMVSVEDSMLRLTASHNGGPGSCISGAIHSKEKVYTGPGSYWEAKLRTPDVDGWLPAFWAKSNSPTPNWPPEIDFFEMLGNNPNRSTHNVHYDPSGGMGNGDSTSNMAYSDIESTTNWHVYGCAWYNDSVEMYVDGTHVGTHTNGTAMSSLRTGAPFYMMLNIHVGKTPGPDYSQNWGGATMDVDWVRVWEMQ